MQLLEPLSALAMQGSFLHWVRQEKQKGSHITCCGRQTFDSVSSVQIHVVWRSQVRAVSILGS